MSRTVQEDIFGLRGTPRRMLEVLASMHQESADRWTPRRLILANWWLFDEPQEILFGRGNLMLTGKNESGKSTVLITIATLVLDRLFEPVRIDTTGGGDRTVRYYLVGKDEAEEGHPFYHEERTGYVALEFERGNSGRFRTAGIALRTSRRFPDRKVKPWSFVLNEGCRVLHDVELVNPSTRKPLREPELRAAVGDRGQVFGEGQQREYQEAVNNLLFGFPSLDDYHRYLDVLHVLRTPKLGDGLSPARVERLLVDSLAPVDMAPIDQAAESFQRMDTIEAEIRRLREQRELADKLNEVQIAALEAETNRFALAYIEALTDYSGRQKELDRDLGKLDEAAQKIRKADDRLAFLADEIARVAGPLQSLEEEIGVHGAGDVEKRLEEIRKKRAELAAELASLRSDQAREKREAEDALTDRRSEDDRWENTTEEYKTRLGDVIADAKAALWPDLEQRATTALAEVGTLDVATDGQIGAYLGANTIRAEAEQRALVVGPILDAHGLLTIARAAHGESIANERRARNEYQKRDSEHTDRTGDTDVARVSASGYVRKWAGEFDLFRASTQGLDAVYASVAAYTDPAVPASRLCQPLFAEFEQEWSFANELARLAVLEHARRTEAIEEVDARIARLTSDADIEPERSEATVAARNVLLAHGIPSVPLYEACSFTEALPAGAQLRIEEALEAAGLLDALVVPRSSEADVERILGSEGLGDRWIRPAAAPASELWLSAVAAPTVERGDIELAIGAISFSEDVLPVDAPMAVSCTGRWRLGDLVGRAACGTERVRYIGELNRRTERERQLVAARDKRRKLKEEAARFEEDRAEANRRESDLRDAWESLRDASVFAALTAALVRQDEARIRRDEAGKNMAVLAADVTRKHTAMRQAEQALDDACGGARYLLSRREDDVRRVRDSLVRLARLAPDVAGTLQRLSEVRRRWAAAGSRYTIADQRVSEFGQRIDAKGREDLSLKGSEEEKERQLAEESVDRNQLMQRRDQLRKEKEAYDDEARQLELEKNGAAAVIRTLTPSVEDRQRDRDRALAEKVGAESRFQGVLSAYPATAGWAEDAVVMGLDRFALDRIGRVAKNEIPGEAERAKGDLMVKLNEVRDAFQGYNARIEGGLMAMFTDVNEDLRVYDLLIRLDEDLAQRENALDREDQEIIEKVFLRHVTEAIRTAITRTEAWRDRVNALLDEMDLFKGGTLRIQWHAREKKIETDAYDPKELVALFSQTGISLREDRQEHLVQIFRDMIGEIRQRARDLGLAIDYRVELMRLLDYKQWYNLEVHRKDETGRFRHLTRKLYGYGSMGRRSLDLILPLIAAVHGRLSVAAPDAPRIVGFDEAFAGVDDQNAAQIYALLDRVGLNWVMATEKATHYGPHLAGVVTYEFLNDGRDVAPLASVWDGRVHHSFEAEELPALPATQNRPIAGI